MQIKPLASETTLTTATNVGSATLVRLINTGTLATVTLAEGATTLATFSMAANEVILVEKDPTNTLAGGASIRAVKIAFTN